MSPLFSYLRRVIMDIKYIKASYIRGYLIKNNLLNNDLVNDDLFSLTEESLNKLDEIGNNYNLKLYYFKLKEDLPRVKIVLGFLKNIYPKSLLDVGSGRGVFLFPFLREFDYTNVTSIDILDYRIQLLEYIRLGGLDNLNPINASICDLNLSDNSYDVVTLLEVLEHIPNVRDAVKNAIRIAKSYIIVTVPSKEDDNPEHIHLLTKKVLTEMFNYFGVYNLKFGGVNGHLFLIAKKE